MNVQVEVTWRTLRTIAHSLMVHAQVLVACIHSALIYTEYHFFLVLPVKYLINYASLPRHLNMRQVRNLQYCIYVFYFFDVLCKKLLHMLIQSR